MEKTTEFQDRLYPLLEVNVRQGNTLHKAVAFNEVQIKSASGGMLDIDFSIGNRVTQNVQ